MIINGCMKRLTKDDLGTIQQMAELFYCFEDICICLEIDTEEFYEDFSNKTGDFYRSYMTGYLTGDMKLRKSIQNSANNGSHPAQQLLLKMQEDLLIKSKANE